MKKDSLRPILLFLPLFILAGGIFYYWQAAYSLRILRDTWSGYKHYFIDSNGRVMRIKDNDTVSEGQAYAMLRAAWMGEKDVFDRCYLWSEKNISRIKTKSDNLLAWHWKDGKVTDWMPASDADIDYAFSLILAHNKWPGNAPAGAEDYLIKAKAVLMDILELETYSAPGSRLYLLPWPIGNKDSKGRLPINPSYYAPAYFRVFYNYTGDKRWLDLIDTTYYMLFSISQRLGNERGVGLVPDWCSVDSNDNFYPLKGKSTGFGWEAVRVPLRVALDFVWFKEERAREFFDLGFTVFIQNQWRDNKAVFCEYEYDGKVIRRYQNPLFYASYYAALKVSVSRDAGRFLKLNRSYLSRKINGWVYLDEKDYYVNSLSWWAEGLRFPKAIRY